MYTNGYFLLILIYFCSLNAFAQSNFSESFIHFPKTLQLHAPSHICLDNDFQSNFAYKSYFGRYSVIRTYYADANIRLQRKQESGLSEGKKHIVGGGIYNDREGEYFNKVRAIVRYALHIPLKEELILSGGVAFHLINYNFSASAAGASGSSFAWAGQASTTLYSPTFRLGVSIDDLNNPTVTPISYSFLINRYINLYGEKFFDIGPGTQIRGAARCNWIPGIESSYNIQAGAVFSGTVGVSAFYYTGRGYGLILDLNKIELYKNYFDFSLTYLVPQSNVYPVVNQYEINLQYYIFRE
jgi:hypothetical protein